MKDFNDMKDKELLGVLGLIIEDQFALTRFKTQVCARARRHSLWTETDHKTLTDLIETMREIPKTPSSETIRLLSSERELNAECRRLSKILLGRMQAPEKQEAADCATA